MSHPVPILRWAGGKRYLIADLLRRLPSDATSRRYHEPFLGAATLFFALRPKRAVLSDANEHLVGCYRRVRDNPDAIASYLRKHARVTGYSHYYRVRAVYNRST